jgi:hypothetical protein
MEGKMKRFLVTYHGSGMPSDPAMAKEAKAAFGAWLSKAGKAVVDPGAPVHSAARVSKVSPSAQVEIGGYSILQGETLDEVKAVLETHPFVGRGGTLQVFEVLAV